MAIFENLDNIVPLPADQTNYNRKSDDDFTLPKGEEIKETKPENTDLPADKRKIHDLEITEDQEKLAELPEGIKQKELPKEDFTLPKGETIKKNQEESFDLPKGNSPGKLETDEVVVKPDSIPTDLDWTTPGLPNPNQDPKLETDKNIKLPDGVVSGNLEDGFVELPTVEYLGPQDEEPNLPADQRTGESDDTLIVSPPNVLDQEVDENVLITAPSWEDTSVEDPFILAPSWDENVKLSDGVEYAPSGTSETPKKFDVQQIEFLGNSNLPDWVNKGFNVIDEAYSNAQRWNNLVGDSPFALPMPAINYGMNIRKDLENFIDDPKTALKNVGDLISRYSKDKNPFNDQYYDMEKGIVNLPESPYKYAELMDRPQYEILAPGLAEGEKKARIVEDIGMSQFSFQGRKSAVGMTMRLNHLWDVKVQRFGLGPEKRTWVPDLGVDGSYFYAQINKDGNVVNDGHQARSTESYRDNTKPAVINDFEDTMPILSYSLDLKGLTNKDVDLFNGSTISIPEAVRRASTLTLEILDDENKRWRRWFQRYVEVMYDEERNIVKPYKTCCVKVTIYQYRADWMVLSHKVYLAVLKNYQIGSNGSGNGIGTPDILDTEWSIVGEIPVTATKGPLDIA